MIPSCPGHPDSLSTQSVTPEGVLQRTPWSSCGGGDVSVSISGLDPDDSGDMQNGSGDYEERVDSRNYLQGGGYSSGHAGQWRHKSR